MCHCLRLWLSIARMCICETNLHSSTKHLGYNLGKKCSLVFLTERCVYRSDFIFIFVYCAWMCLVLCICSEGELSWASLSRSCIVRLSNGCWLFPSYSCILCTFSCVCLCVRDRHQSKRQPRKNGSGHSEGSSCTKIPADHCSHPR